MADTSTPIPGGAGMFANVGVFSNVVASGPNVAFDGRDSAGNSGIYRFVDGVLERVADETTIIPGRQDTFTLLQSPAIEGTDVAFLGSVGSGPNNYVGLFSTVGGLHKVVDVSDQPPGQPADQSDEFFTFGGPTLNGGLASFVGSTVFGHQGIYRETVTDAFSVLVDNNTFIPNAAGKFTFFYGSIQGQGDDVVFKGGDANTFGMYLWDGDLNFLVDRTTPTPGGSTWQNFGSPSLSQGNVAFFASETTSLSNPGIYAYLDGQLRTIADTTTIIPGSGAGFALFAEAPSVSDGNVLFGGEGSGNFREGIYLWLHGTIFPVIKRNEILGAKVISSIGTGSQSLGGRHFAMRVVFTDMTPAVYLAALYAVHDADFDGRVNWSDLSAFVECLAGPGETPEFDAPYSCLQTFGVDSDGDVDLADYASLARRVSLD